MIHKEYTNILVKHRIKFMLIFFPVYLISGIIYKGIGDYASGLTFYNLSTGFDEIIPFIPEFEFIYILLYVLPVIPIIVIDNTIKLKQALASYIITNVIAFIIFVLFPVYCPKPLLDLNTVSGYVLSIEHSMDTPMNSFPSLHACVSLLVYFFCRGSNTILSWTLFIIAIMIGASAVLIKQHYVLDIVSGYFLAYAGHKITLVVSRYNYFLKIKNFLKIC